MDIASIGMIVVLLGMMYFFMIRPDQKKKKAHRQMMDELGAGAEITTIGGIIGKIVDIDGDTVTIETGEDRVRIEITKWAISAIGRATVQGR